jgi:hypothetical protein
MDVPAQQAGSFWLCTLRMICASSSLEQESVVLLLSPSSLVNSIVIWPCVLYECQGTAIVMHMLAVERKSDGVLQYHIVVNLN